MYRGGYLTWKLELYDISIILVFDCSQNSLIAVFLNIFRFCIGC